jgi:hypothetical protein
MNTALTPLTQKFSPTNPQWYAARVVFLDKTPETGLNIEELSTIVHHEQGFRTNIANIDINFYPSRLITVDITNDVSRPYPTTLVNNNENSNPDPLIKYLNSKLSLISGFYYPINRENQIINRDSLEVFANTINYELENKKLFNSLSANNKCGSFYHDVYYTANPSGTNPWYGPLKNTPVNSNIEFLMDPSINRSITYLFIESIYNIINNLPQRSIIPHIAAKSWNSSTFNNLTSSLRSSLLNEFNNDKSIVQKPLEFIIFIHFPYVEVKTRKYFDVEVFGNRVLNMNPLKPNTTNIQNKPDYRRF